MIRLLILKKDFGILPSHSIYNMSNTIQQGKVTFVNHEKQYVMIEYEANGKKKAVNGIVDEKTQQELIDKKIIRKAHQYHIGDIVNFVLRLSGRGDKMIAADIQYLYNTALDVLLNKANTLNRFTGYIKEADGKYFVKEIETYIFFPVPFSPWQVPPAEANLNEPVFFSLENREKKEKVFAKLFQNDYIPEFHALVKAQKKKEPLEATVSNITPHGVFLEYLNGKFQSKLKPEQYPDLKTGDKLLVAVTHIGDTRIIVEPVAS